MRIRGRLLSATLTLAASVILAAAIGAIHAEEPRKGGILVVATTNDTPDLDIQKYLASSQHNALLPMFDGLVEKDWTADADYPPIIPGLASSWSVSPDGKTYTFNLRKGVKFHDGTPFNAAAADFNFQRMTNPKHKYYDTQVGSSAQGVLKGSKVRKPSTNTRFKSNSIGRMSVLSKRWQVSRTITS